MINLMTYEERTKLKNDPRFKESNAVWNSEGFNRPSCIGSAMGIVNGCKTKEDWIFKYLYTGAKRLSSILMCNTERDRYLCNAENGRTEAELEEIAIRFQEALLKNGIAVSDEEAYAMVWIRIFDETWNGYRREKDLMREISSATGTRCLHTTPEEDEKYAVDGLVYSDSKMLCGIQIKPQSYKGNANFLLKAKEINNHKNEAFSREYKVPVFYVYYDDSGFVNKGEIVWFVNYTKENVLT